MKLTDDEKKRILEGFSWIKVGRFVDDPDASWEDRYKKLEKHHAEETKFLIDFIRKLIKDGAE